MRQTVPLHFKAFTTRHPQLPLFKRSRSTAQDESNYRLLLAAVLEAVGPSHQSLFSRTVKDEDSRASISGYASDRASQSSKRQITQSDMPTTPPARPSQSNGASETNGSDERDLKSSDAVGRLSTSAGIPESHSAVAPKPSGPSHRLHPEAFDDLDWTVDGEDSAQQAEEALQNSKKLNQAIIAAPTTDAILGIWESRGSEFNQVNVSTAFYRIAKYMRGMKQVRRKAVREDPRLRTLVGKVDSLVWELDATSIRTVAWAHQRQKLGSPNLPRLLLQRFEELLPTLRRGQLGGIMLSLLSLRQITKEALHRLNDDIIQWLMARVAKTDRRTRLQLRDIADTLWSYATLNVHNASVSVLLAKLAKQTFIEPHPHDLLLINIARIAWCFSRVNLADDELYDGLAKNALVSLRNAHDLGHEDDFSSHLRLLWSFTRGYSFSATVNADTEDRLWRNELGLNDPIRTAYISAVPERKEVLSILCRKLSLRLGKATWLDITMLMQALSYMKLYDPELMAATDDWILQNYFDLNIQAVSTILWSHANLCHDNPEVMEVLAKQARDLLKAGTDTLTAEGANAIIMACARMGVDDLPESRKLVAASARWFIRNEGDVYAHRNIPVVVQGLAHVGIPADDYLLEAYELLSSQMYTWDLNKARLYDADCVFSSLEPGWLGDEDFSPRLWEFRMSSEKAWQRFQREAFSLVQETASDIAKTLVSMELEPQLLLTSRDYLLDISLPDQGVAIQVLDSPWMAVSTQRPLGFKRVKQRMLELRNWRVINIPELQWKSLSTDQERQQLLRDLLAPSGLVEVDSTSA